MAACSNTELFYLMEFILDWTNYISSNNVTLLVIVLK